MTVPTRSDLMRLAEDVCKAEGVAIPSIRFRDHHLAASYDDHIQMPSPEWLALHHGVGILEHSVDDFHDIAACYQLTLIHELSHWIERERTGDTRHSPFMYATMFRLAVAHGFDLDFALKIETPYKPRASKQGWKLYHQWLADEVAAA